MANDDNQGPQITGRDEDGSTYDRSGTRRVCAVRVDYTTGAIGSISVRLFESLDDEDRGGLVLRIEGKDQGSSFIPYCKALPGGVELHFAGDAESAAAAIAIVEALKRYKPRAHPGGGITSMLVDFDLEPEHK